MPEFTLKEVRMPELHLPEIKRDDIVRSLSGIRLPEVDLARARQATIKIPSVSLTSSDIGKVIAAGAAIARFARPMPSRGFRVTGRLGRRSRSPIARIVQPRRRASRWPFAVGVLVVIAVGIWAALRQPRIRRQVDLATGSARERIETWRANAIQPADSSDEPVATGVEVDVLNGEPSVQPVTEAIVTASKAKTRTPS